MFLVNALEAVPGTPLFHRIQAEGRLVNPSYTDSAAAARYQSGVGGTNFRPLNMTQEELLEGLEWLFQKLYDPEAFAARLMGNLSHFQNVGFRPEALRLGYLGIFFRLAAYYGGKGPASRGLFWGCLLKTLRRSPRIVGQMVIYLGMYMHFCEVHRRARQWNPWAPGRPKAPPRARPYRHEEVSALSAP